MTIDEGLKSATWMNTPGRKGFFKASNTHTEQLFKQCSYAHFMLVTRSIFSKVTQV